MSKWILGWLFLLGLTVSPASAQLAEERINDAILPLRPGPRLQTGPGTVRLAGMGGFTVAVLDENLEFNLWDATRNPAAFGDDRDSWSIDLRYTHNEYVERDPQVSLRNDIRTNEGSLILGYYSPRKLGVGGQIDYAEVNAGLQSTFENNYTVAGMELAGNLYVARNLSVGLSLSQMSETESAFSPFVYNISHDGTRSTGGLGLAFTPVAGVTLGAHGEASKTSFDGESRGPFHTDSFTWDQPRDRLTVQGAVDRGRLKLAADFTRRNVQGEESVRISWSDRFIRNPTNDDYTLATDTFSEDRQTDRTYVRGHVKVIEGLLSVSFGAVAYDETFDVVANPNYTGSRTPGRVESKADAQTLGFAWKLFDRRLVFAGEIQQFETRSTFVFEDESRTDRQDGWSARLGGEYLISETLAGRAGVIHEQVDSRLESFRPYLGDPYARNDQITAVAFGLGLVPSGAIWQLDVSYEVKVKSDIDANRSTVGAYIRYLF